MTIICYTDPADGIRKWDELPGQAELALRDFVDMHPGLKPEHYFLFQDDMIAGAVGPREAFMRRAADHGLSPSDFDAPVLLANGNKGYLRGLDTRRSRNMFKVWNCATQRHIYVDEPFIRQAIRRYREKFPNDPYGTLFQSGVESGARDPDAPGF